MNKFATELSALKKNFLFRQPTDMEFLSPTKALIDNKEYLIMNSNNYLGLSYHPQVIEAGIKALQTYGSGSTGSRLTTGSFNLFQELEKDLANFKNTEAALVVNTGFTTNFAILSTIPGKGDFIISDELNHASIIDGCRFAKGEKIIYPHKDMIALAKILEKLPYSATKLIVTDGVFSMDGDIAPLDEIVYLAKKYNCLVMVDDAHGTGVLANGHGTAAYFNVQGDVDFQMGTLSKALGSLGGFVCTSQLFKDYLINKARPFIFSTAISPVDVATAQAALKLIVEDPSITKQLAENINNMRKYLQEENIPCSTETAIFPLMVGDNHLALSIAQALYEQNIILSAIRPPTVAPGTARLRLTISAAHSIGELKHVAQALGVLWRKYKLESNLS